MAADRQPVSSAAYTDSEGARVGNAPDSGNAGDERPVQPTVPSDAPSAASPRTVCWIDSSLQNGQVDRDDFPKPVTITSVGFVVDETDEYVTLARDDMGDGDYRGLCAIPKIAVLPSING